MKMSAHLRIERMRKNNQNSSNVSEEVLSLTNDCNIQSKLHKVQEKLLSVKLYSNSSSSEESPSGTDEEATNKQEEEVSKEEINKSGDAFSDWFNWNKNQRKKASLAAGNNQTEPEGFKCLKSTEESFLKSCQTPSKKVLNHHENMRTPLQQHDTQEKLNTTKTPSESNNVINKSKPTERTLLQQDVMQGKLCNSRNHSELNRVNGSKAQHQTNKGDLTPYRIPLQPNDLRLKLNKSKAQRGSNYLDTMASPEMTPMQHRLIRSKLKSNPSNSQQEDGRVQAERRLPETIGSPTRLLDVLAQHNQENSTVIANILAERQLREKLLTERGISSEKKAISEETSTHNRRQVKTSEKYTTSSCLAQDRLAKFRSNPSNSQQDDGGVQAERRLPETIGSPTRLLDVLAQHNQENSEVVASILAERQLRQKLLTERGISSREKAISEDTSPNNRRQVKTSEKYTTSSCLAQDRLAKLRSNR